MKKLLLILALAFSLNGEIVIEAIGYGKTISESKESSLAELGRVIISSVNSEFTKKESMKNGQASKEIHNTVSIKSSTILTGVQYRNLAKEDGYFVTKAILSRDAVNQSIRILENKINVRGSRLSRSGIREKLEIISILKPLFSYTHNRSTKFVDKKETEFLSYLNQAQIQFHLVPKSAKIEIGGKSYPAFQSIFLSAGKYRFAVSKKGYFSERGYLRVSNGEKVIKNITLLQSSNSQKEIFLDIKNRRLKGNFENSLIRYKISQSQNSHHKFKLKVRVSREFKSQVSGYRFYDFAIETKLYKNGKLFKTKQAKMRNKTIQYFNGKSKKISQALVKSLFANNDIKRFFK